jgi:hypothetical protein
VGNQHLYPEPISDFRGDLSPFPPFARPGLLESLLLRYDAWLLDRIVHAHRRRIASLVDRRRRYRLAGSWFLWHWTDEAIGEERGLLVASTRERRAVRERMNE